MNKRGYGATFESSVQRIVNIFLRSSPLDQLMKPPPPHPLNLEPLFDPSALLETVIYIKHLKSQGREGRDSLQWSGPHYHLR